MLRKIGGRDSTTKGMEKKGAIIHLDGNGIRIARERKGQNEREKIRATA